MGREEAIKGRIRDLTSQHSRHLWEIGLITKEIAELTRELTMPDETMYLSGPMMGYPEYNFPAFKAAAEWLRSQGHTVVSPHEIGTDSAEEKAWEHYLKEDIKALMDCDAIVMMEGWSMSRGARRELSTASDLHYHVYFLRTDPWDLIDMGRGPVVG